MKTLAVIPAYNEAASVADVVRLVRAERPDLDVLVVDDGSEDQTTLVLREAKIPSIRLSVHLGIGGAVRAGIRYAQRRGYRRVVRLDADGQHPATQLPPLLDALDQGADAARGSRYQRSNGYRTPLSRRAGQRVLAAALSALVGSRVTDPTSGFWAFGPRAIALLSEAHPTGYPEPELILLLRNAGLSVREVPVEMRDRVAGKTSLTVSRAMLALARACLAMVVVPLRDRAEEHP